MRLIFAALLLLSSYLYPRYSAAQTVNQKLDSLQTVLRTAKVDTNKVLLLCEVSMNYYQADPEEGIVYGTKALELAKKTQV